MEYQEITACPVGIHKNTFFQLIYILKGAGVHQVNGNSFLYHKDHFFLVLPQDSHHLEVKETSTILTLKFSDIYLKAHQQNELYNNWIPTLEYIFQNSPHSAGCIIRNESDKPLLQAIIAGLVHEYENPQPFQMELIYQLVNVLLTIVARSIFIEVPVQITSSNWIMNPQQLVLYIHKNIYRPDMLKAEVMARHFNLSVNYISEYFKKHTGGNLLQYILNYKLKLVETRLQHSEMRISEIAYELNFTDESHLNRAFRKRSGINPTTFRKKFRELN